MSALQFVSGHPAVHQPVGLGRHDGRLPGEPDQDLHARGALLAAAQTGKSDWALSTVTEDVFLIVSLCLKGAGVLRAVLLRGLRRLLAGRPAQQSGGGAARFPVHDLLLRHQRRKLVHGVRCVAVTFLSKK